MLLLFFDVQSDQISITLLIIGQNPLHQFLRSKSVTSWRLSRFKLATSPQHKRQVCNKLARAKVHCVRCAVSFPKFHYNNLLQTCWPCR